MWRDNAQEIGDARHAEEERLRLEAEAEAARLRAIRFEKQRRDAEHLRVFEENERLRREAEEKLRRAEEARVRALAEEREKGAILLQAALRRGAPHAEHRVRCGKSGVKVLQVCLVLYRRHDSR